jgi:hypothetical protein
MSAWQRLRRWVGHWQMSLVLVAVTAVFVFAVWILAYQFREAREADLRACQRGNESRALLLDFVLKASADPDPRQFEFIADPKLREGALDQARRGRAEQRDRATRTFTPVNCDAEYPPT